MMCKWIGQNSNNSTFLFRAGGSAPAFALAALENSKKEAEPSGLMEVVLVTANVSVVDTSDTNVCFDFIFIIN